MMRSAIFTFLVMLTFSVAPEALVAQETPLELHFTDNYAGEEIVVSLNSEEVRRFRAKTKFQIGLAEVVHLLVKSGDVVRISVSDLKIEEKITVDDIPRYVIVRLQDGKMTVEQTNEQQRYL